MSNTESSECKINHPYIYVQPYTKSLWKVSLKKESDEWQDFLDDALDYSKEAKSWIIKVDELDQFRDLLENINEEKKSKKESSSEESSSEESDSTDDELIQKTLSRRLKSESRQLIIEEENVEDSLDEDVISTTRRLRYVYKLIRDLRKRIEILENK